MRTLSRRTFLGTVGALTACGSPGPARSDADFELAALADAIGRAAAASASALVAEARARGVPLERVLGATWVAPLLHGGLPSDVHAVLVLPAIARLPAAGADAWAAAGWAAANATAWCSNARPGETRPAPSPSAASLRSAIAAQDLDAAAAHALALAPAAAIDALAREALEPRDDVHAAIYAAQLDRVSPLLPAAELPRAAAHVARYLARDPRWDGELPPIEVAPDDRAAPADLAWALASGDGIRRASEEAVAGALVLVARAARAGDPSVSGIGVHRTTHLDAMLHLARRLPEAERGAALAKAVRSVVREVASLGGLPPPMAAAEEAARTDPVRYRRELAARVARDGRDEHAFKYWAALDALDALVPADVRPALWSGAAYLGR
jgi:hypothetical protein